MKMKINKTKKIQSMRELEKLIVKVKQFIPGLYVLSTHASVHVRTDIRGNKFKLL
jgi:hypothetical protein